jgi:hypothetical protein
LWDVAWKNYKKDPFLPFVFLFLHFEAM